MWSVRSWSLSLAIVLEGNWAWLTTSNCPSNDGHESCVGRVVVEAVYMHLYKISR